MRLFLGQTWLRTPGIRHREDAPLEYGFAEIASGIGLSSSSIRNHICGVLLEAPDPNNCSVYPNIWDEVLGLVDYCGWYKFYDIAEVIWRSREYGEDEQEFFLSEHNRLFHEKGIGWEPNNPLGFDIRGDANFTNATEKAVLFFQETGRATAAAEIRNAL